MAILKMKKLRICGVSEEQTQLIRQLQLLGSVEIGAPCALTDTQGVLCRRREKRGCAAPHVRPAHIRTGDPQTL